MAIEKSLHSVPVTVLESRPPLVLDAETPVGRAVGKMAEVGASALLLTSSDRLVGIFTERDYVQRVLGHRETLEQPISSVMTTNPAHVTGKDPIRTVISRMHEGRFRHIPVTTSHLTVVGCVRHADVGQYLVQHYRDKILDLPPDPERVAKTPEGG